MFWHIDSDILALLVIIALYVYNTLMLPREEEIFHTRRFLRCIRIGIIAALIDIAASIVMDFPENRVLYHFLMTPYFITIELVIVEWYYYALSILYQDDKSHYRIIAGISCIPYAIYTLVVLSNPWSGLMYSLDKNNVYSRGPLFFGMIVIYGVYVIALFVVIMLRRKCIPKGYSWGILLSMPAILTVAIVAQLSVPGWLVLLPGYAFSLLASFLFLQKRRMLDTRTLVANLSEAASTDTLTGLLNRTGMQQAVALAQGVTRYMKCFVAIIDMDDLKSINDNYGHPEGDKAIKLLAKTIKAHFRATDAVARFGGDEFVVYVAGVPGEMQVYRTLRTLLDELDALRTGEDGNIHVRASIGAVMGTVGEESLDALCSKADAALYHVKRHGKNNVAIYRSGMETPRDSDTKYHGYTAV